MAEAPRVGMIIPNLFLLAPVEAAVRGAGAVPESLTAAEAVDSPHRLVVVDLDALRGDPATTVRALVTQGKHVLAFGPHVNAELLAACRAAGAVVLPRSAFLSRLPELLAVALGRTPG